MSESKPKSRYWVTFLLDDLPVGASFGVEALHLTVLPWFVTDTLGDEQVADSFMRTFARLKPVTVFIGETKELGSREVVVSMVEPVVELSDIHARALAWLSEIRSRWALKNPYVGHDYRPHIRRRTGTNLRPGDKIPLKHLSLIRANRTEDNIREVAARVELDG